MLTTFIRVVSTALTIHYTWELAHASTSRQALLWSLLISAFFYNTVEAYRGKP